jgi:hypothetical protein
MSGCCVEGKKVDPSEQAGGRILEVIGRSYGKRLARRKEGEAEEAQKLLLPTEPDRKGSS